jgi:antitoxin component HigA of HigAB toxin-antitoxin module
MDLPTKDLTPNEIRDYWKMAEAVLHDWDVIKTATSAPEFGAYRERLSDARHGIETILDVLEGQHSDLKRKIGAVKLLVRDIDRHSDLAKDRFWALKRP